jgi:hypothetical protein
VHWYRYRKDLDLTQVVGATRTHLDDFGYTHYMSGALLATGISGSTGQNPLFAVNLTNDPNQFWSIHT